MRSFASAADKFLVPLGCRLKRGATLTLMRIVAWDCSETTPPCGAAVASAAHRNRARTLELPRNMLNFTMAAALKIESLHSVRFPMLDRWLRSHRGWT